jgi:hypothetical protein
MNNDGCLVWKYESDEYFDGEVSHGIFTKMNREIGVNNLINIILYIVIQI